MATETTQVTKNEVVIKKPSMFKVIFNNDNVTPMEFVKDLLKAVFKHSDEQALNLTMEIHNNGKGIAGVYTFEIAEQKHNEAVLIARTHGHPLNINIESD